MITDDQSSRASSSDQAEPGDDDPSPLDGLRAAATEETERLQRGREVSLLGVSVPVRVLIALGIFVLVFMLAWMALWGLLGGVGLALGWIPAAVVALLAIKLAGRSPASSRT